MKSLNWKYLLTEVLLLVLGLFLALELNEWSALRKVEQRKKVALSNIRLELQENKEELNSNGNNEALYELAGELYAFQAEGINPEEGYLVLHTSPAELDSLQLRHPQNVWVQDSSKVGDLFHYQVQLNFELNIANLSDLAWETTKLGALMDKFSFACTKGILPAYQIQEKFNRHQDKMIDVYADQDIPGFLIQVLLWKEYHRALNEEYDLALDALENCP